MRDLPFVLHDCPQQSDAWRQLRLGRLTGTGAADLLATIKSGEAASRRNLRLRLILERLTGKTLENGWVTPAMQVGIDREADARAAYEALTGQLVTESGFCAHPTLMAGCSLDGHIGDFDRLLSIKCRQPAAHWEFLRFGTIPVAALSQMRHELYITGADAHDYFSFNPDFPPALQARVKTLSRDELDIPGYAAAAVLFLDEVDRELAVMQGWEVAV